MLPAAASHTYRDVEGLVQPLSSGSASENGLRDGYVQVGVNVRSVPPEGRAPLDLNNVGKVNHPILKVPLQALTPPSRPTTSRLAASAMIPSRSDH